MISEVIWEAEGPGEYKWGESRRSHDALTAKVGASDRSVELLAFTILGSNMWEMLDQ